ncbi:putative integral membrane protein [Golovinomyces cichoracearum]|uniref:Putative integral membrane protein n=1 Tax=Golovinomyces cichoracearum TaxID=62708 RepID=A0A420IWK9_9PEZI|nr:putative integral membrane protein [Golovinomyces cichoracearum]
MPTCDLDCRDRVLTSVRSSKLDAISLLCTDFKLQEQLGKCIFSVCPFSDLKLAIEHFAKLCNGYPKQSRCEQIIRTTIIMSILTSFFISLRIKSRWFDNKHLWLDDWIAFVVYALIAGSAVLLVMIAKAGMGEHLWNSNVDSYAMIGKVSYNITVSATKVSILVFYHRVFVNENFQILCKWIIGLFIIPPIIFLWFIIFQCVPIQKVWNPAIPGSCIDIDVMILWGAIVSMIEDVIILIMPIPLLSGLKIGRMEKINVLGLFGLGFFAFITSVLRLKFALRMVRHDYDKPWDLSIIIVWSVVEVDVMLICACLPAIRPLVVRFLRSCHKSKQVMSGSNPSRSSEQEQKGTSQSSLQKSMDHQLVPISPCQGHLGRENYPDDNFLDVNFDMTKGKKSRELHRGISFFCHNHEFFFENPNCSPELSMSDQKFFP